MAGMISPGMIAYHVANRMGIPPSPAPMVRIVGNFPTEKALEDHTMDNKVDAQTIQCFVYKQNVNAFALAFEDHHRAHDDPQYAQRRTRDVIEAQVSHMDAQKSKFEARHARREVGLIGTAKNIDKGERQKRDANVALQETNASLAAALVRRDEALAARVALNDDGCDEAMRLKAAADEANTDAQALADRSVTEALTGPTKPVGEVDGGVEARVTEKAEFLARFKAAVKFPTRGRVTAQNYAAVHLLHDLTDEGTNDPAFKVLRTFDTKEEAEAWVERFDARYHVYSVAMYEWLRFDLKDHSSIRVGCRDKEQESVLASFRAEEGNAIMAQTSIVDTGVAACLPTPKSNSTTAGVASDV